VCVLFQHRKLPRPSWPTALGGSALYDAGPSAVVNAELLAWRDKSGDVWQNLGTALIEQALAEPTTNPG